MSLELDNRQRTMLLEMGVRVWLPETVAAAPLVAEVPRSVAQAPLNATHASPAVAIENIAVSESRTVATAQKDAKTQMPDKTMSVAVPAMLADGIADMDWPTLAYTVANCQACQLCIGRQAPVFGAGDAPRQADWMVVGQPPDDAEERAGTPFVDQAGQLLDNMLKALGVSRRGADSGVAVTSAATTAAAAAYVTNVVKCRPSVVRIPELQELITCENYLRREVALVQPKVILAMGRFAVQTLLQGSLPEVAGIPLGKLRGQIYRYQGIPVVVTYHPSYLLRTQQDKARAWVDLCLALDVMR